MAMFHFRLKSDKKPDGTKISAVKHVDYIRHEGNFADNELWLQNNKFVGNFISSAQIKNTLDGQNFLLYKTDDFGSIRNSEHGIEVTENSSPTTLAIALILANETMNHQPLIISGSTDFQKSLLNAAILFDLDISFADKLLQNQFLKTKEQIIYDRKIFSNSGGIVVSHRPLPKSYPSATQFKTIDDVTKIGLRLPSLSQLSLVHSESEGTDLLLPIDESRQLEQFAKKSYNLVRWNFSSERKKLAVDTAKTILQRVEETMDYVFASSHVEYINREKAFARRGGCIFHSHKLPKWAKNDPKKFFKAADKYESKGNRRYMEIEFALPNELKTVEQYRQIIDAFIDKHLSNHYFAYAIHDKIGAMSNGQHHPHVHIMFSERLIDDAEKIKERSPKNFFKYPARKKKDGSELTFEEKFNRGAPKNRNWAEKSFLAVLRADCAQIQNDVLEKNGFSIRVDHRTLKAQKEEAVRKGDTFLARLLDRIPEEYVGLISCQDTEKIERLKKFRSLRQRHFDLLSKIDAMTKQADELDIKDSVQKSSINAKKMLTQNFGSQPLRDLQAKIFSAVADVNKWKRVIISYRNAEEQAKLEYMTPSERELWHTYFESLAQKKRLEDFLADIKTPTNSQKASLDEIQSAVKKKIFALLSSVSLLKKSVVNIENKLDSPDCKKNIQLVTHQILQSNLHTRKMLKLANDNLERYVDELQNLIFEQSSEHKNIFKTREIYDIIRRQFFGLKKEYEKNLDLKFALQLKIIYPQRATDMAKNIFVHGDFKKLRSDLLKLHKDEQKFIKNLSDFNQRKKFFLNRDWSAEERNLFLQEKYSLTKQQTLLELEKNRFANLKISLQNRQIELENLCQLPESKKKIDLIAAGILRKNFKFVRRLEEVESTCKNLSLRLTHTKLQMDTLKEQLGLEHRSTFYKVNQDNLSNHSAASIIADAILHEPQAVQLVALSYDKPLEIDKTWELMSELDKDELRQKKILREL